MVRGQLMSVRSISDKIFDSFLYITLELFVVGSTGEKFMLYGVKA